jgi:glycosyltransferase involved in cell wall biosynthesis
MNVLIPFFDLTRFDRYVPQLSYLADNLDRLDILYRWGQPPKSHHPKFNFIKFDLPKKGHKYLDWFLGRDVVPSFVPSDLDLVYSLSGLWMNVYGRAISEFWDIPHVVRLRGDMSSVRLYQGRGAFQRAIFRQIHFEALKQATLITPIVEKYQLDLMRKGFRNVGDTVPNGIKVSYDPVHDPETFSPSYIGRISKEKGSEFLEELISETPQYNWTIAGDIQDQDFTVPAHANYLGYVPYNEIKAFYDHSSVVVMPSLAEGFPNTILEAYAHGKPVIGTREAIPAEIRRFGVRLRRQEMRSWINALDCIDKIGTPPNQGERIKEYVRENYSWELYGSRMRDQLDKAISVY